MGGRKRKVPALIALTTLGLAVLGVLSFAGWMRWERTRGEDRDRGMRVCPRPKCAKPSECAIRCARWFLERNGWMEAKLAKPEAAVLEAQDKLGKPDQPGSEAMRAVLRSRAGTFQRDPTVVCAEPYGFRVLFPRPGGGDPLGGGVVIMTRDYRNLRVSHTREHFKSLPPDCAFTQWANP